MTLPPSIRSFLDRQLGPGVTPGWRWTEGEVRALGWSWGARDGFRRLELRVEETKSEASRDLEEDAYFRAEPVAKLVWEAATEAIVSWDCPPAAREPGPPRLMPEEVVETLRRSLAVPEDGAGRPETRPARKLTLHLTEVKWGRFADGLSVDGDHVISVVNAATGRLVSYGRGRWAPLPAFDGPGPSEAEARGAAERKAPAGAELFDRTRHVVWDEAAGAYRRCWSFWFSVDDPEAVVPAEAPPPSPPSEEEAVGETVVDDAPLPSEPAGRPRKTIVIRVGDDGAVLRP